MASMGIAAQQHASPRAEQGGGGDRTPLGCPSSIIRPAAGHTK